MIPSSPLLSAGLLPQLRRFWPLAAALGGGVILLESSRGPLSSLISLSAAAAGFWLLSGRLRPSGRALPKSVEGWLERCHSVLESFERLEPDADPHEPPTGSFWPGKPCTDRDHGRDRQSAHGTR